MKRSIEKGTAPGSVRTLQALRRSTPFVPYPTSFRAVPRPGGRCLFETVRAVGQTEQQGDITIFDRARLLRPRPRRPWG